MSAIPKSDNRHKIRNYFHLTALWGLFSSQYRLLRSRTIKKIITAAHIPMKTYPSEIIVFCHFVRRFTSTVLISVIVFVWSSVLAFSGSFALTGGIVLGLLEIVSFRLSLSSQAFALARSVSARAVSVGTVRSFDVESLTGTRMSVSR